MVSPAQTKKGYDWLMNKWKTPRGVERKNNPFGLREQEILDDFGHFELKEYINNVNAYQSQAGINNYQPVWEVVSKGGSSFEYYMEMGLPKIIG